MAQMVLKRQNKNQILEVKVLNHSVRILTTVMVVETVKTVAAMVAGMIGMIGMTAVVDSVIGMTATLVAIGRNGKFNFRKMMFWCRLVDY
jgi:hypothetical protein